MINNYFNLNPLRRKIKQSFEELSESMNDYENIDPDVYVFDYFGEIRNKVDLHREELKKEVDQKSDEIIQQLKKREEKCKSNLSKIEKTNLDELKKRNVPSWKLQLRNPNKNEIELNELSSLLNDNLKIVRNYKRKYENNLLDNQSIEFLKYEKSSLFGQLNIVTNLSPNCGELIREYKGHFKTIRSIKCDEKLKKLISASTDKTIKIWDLDTGDCLKTLIDHKKWVTSILILPNNKFISGSCDKTLKIWDLNSYECLNTLTNKSDIYALCLISDNQIACGCRNGSINIWNLDNSKKVIY